MTYYLITFGASPAEDCKVWSFEDNFHACAASGCGDYPPPGGRAFVVQTPEDIANKLIGNLLVGVFNALTESGVNKFESRGVGAERLMKVLPIVAQQEKKMEVQAALVENTGSKKTGKPKVNEGHDTKSEWKKTRRGTMRANILTAMFGKAQTPAEIAAQADVPEDRVLPHIYATWRDCGIGYRVTDDRYSLALPHGVASVDQLLNDPKEIKAE